MKAGSHLTFGWDNAGIALVFHLEDLKGAGKRYMMSADEAKREQRESKWDRKEEER